MCGICGIFNLSGYPVDSPTIIRMMDSLKHRGPDDSGLYVEGNIGLGHRRLSIIDLSEKGRQPLFNEDKTIALVCNGEVYNYKTLRDDLIKKGHVFYSYSDSEVIIHGYEEWAEDIFKRLEGMFAIALWDKNTASLYLVRDQFGIKPLFYYLNQEYLFFASELKGLFVTGKIEHTLNYQMLSDFLTYFYTPGPETMVKNIYHVKPGYYLKIDGSGTIKEKHYWELTWDSSQFRSLTEEETLEMIRFETGLAVKKSLVADVPVGILLSSGIDSSVLFCEMVKSLGSNFHAYTIKFTDASFDETEYAKELTNKYGITHHIIDFDTGKIPSFFDDMIYHLDTLSGNPGIIPEYFYFKFASQHTKIALMGSGGDELFAGYMTYLANKYKMYYDFLPFSFKKFFQRIAHKLPVNHRKYSFDYLAKKFTEGALYPREKSHYWWRTIFTDEDKRKLFNKDIVETYKLNLDSFYKYAYFFDRARAYTDFENQCLYADFYMFLIENANMEVDNLSMAFGLEIRPSMLFQDYVEKMFNLPFKYKLKGRKTKYALRKAYTSYLPQKITWRKKQGLISPLNDLINGSLKSMIHDNVYSKTSLKIFNKQEIDTLLRNHYSKKEDNSFKIFNILCFLRWSDIFIGNGI